MAQRQWKLCFLVRVKPWRNFSCLNKAKVGNIRWGSKSNWKEKQVWLVELGEKWTNKIPNLTWNFTAASTNSHFVEKLCTLNVWWKLWCRLWTSFDLMDLIIDSFYNFCRKLMPNLVPYRSTMAELWDSVETVFSYDARNRNVHGRERQSCGWT
jgi:hypothetical protein